MKREVALRVNGKVCEVSIEPSETLLDVLRERLRLTGAKKGCDVGDCESCAVLIDGKCVPSCLVLAIGAGGKDIVTIEGLAEGGRILNQRRRRLGGISTAVFVAVARTQR